MSLARVEPFFRVDARLVHATTMNVWVPTLGSRRVLVVDDEVANDPRRRRIIELSAMGSLPVDFVIEQEAAFFLERQDPEEAILVLFSTLSSAERALQAGVPLRRLCIGHVPTAEGRREIHPAVHLGAEEMDVIERLRRRGVEVTVQPLPKDKASIVPPAAFGNLRTPTEPPPPLAAQLSRPPLESVPAPGGDEAIVTARLVVRNPKGLHLRAAHLLAKLASAMPCEVQVGTPSEMVNAKSLLGLTALGAACGTQLDVRVFGPNAEQALEEIRRLFESGFSEGALGSSDEGSG